MVCNCNTNTYSQCNECQNGQPCNCPPDYSVLPQPSPCNCCPTGYTFKNDNTNYPNGYCVSGTGTITSSIPCVNCEDAISTDCVIFTGDNPITCGADQNVYGITPGDTLTTIVNKMCILNPNVISAFLTMISNNPELQTILCGLVASCPPVGSGVPILGPIIVTFP